MGRSKTNAKQKSNVPIQFPHDGPVFSLLSDAIDGSAGQVGDDSIEQALKIIGGAHDSGGDGGSSRNAILVFKLCQRLQQPETTTKEQLQALQSFKCTFLNVAKETKKILERDNKSQPDNNDDDSDHLIGLYRLLLEWSVSYETPLPFQRAIQANLKMLGMTSSVFQSATDGITEAKNPTGDNKATKICRDVMASIWNTPEKWQDPMHSLDVSVNYAPLREILQRDDTLFLNALSFLARSETVSTVLEKSSSSSTSRVIDDSLRIVNMLKILLGGMGNNEPTTTTTNSIMTLFETFETFVFALLTNPNLPSDGFNTLGILYGKLLFSSIDSEAEVIQICTSTVSALDSDTQKFQGLSPLARLSMVQGMAATLDAGVLTMASNDKGASALEVCWEYSLRVGQTSTDPLVRWASIKGLSTLASRWKQHQTKTIDLQKETDQEQQTEFQRADLIEKTLDLVFDSWENPPLRKLGTAIPGLFRALVQLVPKRDLRGLCQQALQQPASRKGRYLALEILLPHMPITTSSTETIDPSSAMAIPMESLLEGIGDRGSNAGSIANLWIKVLKRAWEEISSKTSAIEGVDSNSESSTEIWREYWMPSFCRTILDPSLTRRKQVVAFCLPRIADLMKEFDDLKDKLPEIFIGLLKGIDGYSEEMSNRNMETLDDGFADRVLWAELEIVRYSSVMKVSSERLNRVIASCLEKEKFRFALIHSLPFIRIVAFRAMKCVVSSYGCTNAIPEEVAMWRYALPYSIKTNESKEYLSNFLQCLVNFLDRLSAWEATANDGDSSKCGLQPIFHAFVIEFLIDDVILDKGCYPGTIADKEVFAVSLLDCLLAFALQDETFSGENTTMKKNAVFNRKRLPNEDATMDDILRALVRRDVLSSLFGLLHSIWDGTRSVTFKYLEKLVVASQSKNVALAKEFSDKNERKSILARGIYLASSPRQRESDTGARMLGFLYASTKVRTEKHSFLEKVVSLSMDRVSSMRSTLNDILVGKSASSDGSCLPLAHGLVHATRLCIEHDEFERRLLSMTASETNVNLNESMIEVFCKALQLSLSVVADVREGETVEGIDEEALFGTNSGQETDSTPLNVNTGAIGANGTFSSVSTADMEEARARLAMQRVVVGSWLLTKETCAAIASVITTEGYTASYHLVSKVGQLLLSTLTTLKHAGAAFAARDALQQIATSCLKPNHPSDVRSLPSVWSHRLIDEISLNEKVRNSTLRRSTGYALGFLAIMRADVSNKSDSSVLSTPLLKQLLMLSLPPEQRIDEAFAKLNMAEQQADRSKMFVYASTTDGNRHYVPDDQYEARCRVHALNVLRMIILDAPLASVIGPFVGDAIISAILGYDDPSWAIRNSSTMVFAAAMLRVVDSDKNASNSDKTSSNAITLAELLRRYPPLATFIPSVLRTCLEEMEGRGTVKSEMFPLLLMLSRVQPVVGSGTKASDGFVPLLFRCVGSKDHGIRHAAARSVANLSSGATGTALLSDCKRRVKELSGDQTPDWNLLDGVLLVMESLGLSSERELLDAETQGNLFGIVDSMRVPPPCRSTALAILLASPFADTDATISACEKISRDESMQGSIGGSLLYKTASEGLCRFYQSHLWEAAGESGLERCLSKLEAVFVSDIIDVRLHAVKVFKKGIYDSLDRLSAPNKTGQSPLSGASATLNGLAKMLLDCAASELGRGMAEATGSHVPTLRRLSRCFLETVGSAQGGALPSLDHGLLWSVSREITERESSFLAAAEDTGCLESNGGNLLSGNAVEMMSVSISLGRASGALRTCETCERTRILEGVVRGLNDPSGSWRSRHSAALALKTCCEALSGPGFGESDVPGLEALRRSLRGTLLEFLQDSDPDVRAVAVRAAAGFAGVGVGPSAPAAAAASPPPAHHLLLPEWTLERAFPSAFCPRGDLVEDKRSAAGVLLGMVLGHCGGLSGAVGDALDEFRHTDRLWEANGDANGDANGWEAFRTGLVNANTTRKIFEDEDPNPYRERILWDQLAVRSLLGLAAPPGGGGLLLGNPAKDVLERCGSVLSVLAGSEAGAGLFHEPTRVPSVFPALHGLLCASAACLCLEGSGNPESPPTEGPLEKVRASAAKLAAMDGGRRCLQPDVATALNVLGQSRPIRSEDVGSLLFLLKHAEN